MNIISYYTDERYQHLYESRLKRSVEGLGYTIHGAYKPQFYSWPAAIKFKPTYVLQMYQKLGGPLLYLDADCELKKDLDELKEWLETHDLMLRKRDLEDKYNCGVMAFGSNADKILPLLTTWNKITSKQAYDSITIDQKPLEQALEQHKEIVIGELSYNYNFLLSDREVHDRKLATILHHKESKQNDKAKVWRKKFLRDRGLL